MRRRFSRISFGGETQRGRNAIEPRPLKIPFGLTFAELELAREAGTKRLLYKSAPLAELLRFNDFAQPAGQSMLDAEDLTAWVIAHWYLKHREEGGVPDPVAEEVLAEIAAVQPSNAPLDVKGI